MKYLIQFLDDWVDFRITEFISILELYGFNARTIIFDWRYANQDIREEELEMRYREFLQRYREKNEEELENNKDLKSRPQHFLIIEFESPHLLEICRRLVLVKAVFELWSFGSTIEELVRGIKNLPVEYIDPLLASPATWSIQIDSFGRTFTMESKQLIRQYFSFLQFQGKVSLKSPEIELWLILDYLSENQGHSSVNVNDAEYLANLYHANDAAVYFGRKVHDNTEMKKTLLKYNLKKRLYIGPTSLDNVLAMILANFGKVKPGMLCYEPFMGTGSIAIALEHFGCFCIGSDIDPRVLRGEMYAGYSGSSRQDINDKILPEALKATNKSSTPPPVPVVPSKTLSESVEVPANKAQKKSYKYREENHPRKVNGDVRSNFLQYSLPLPELIRMDHHELNRHFHRSVRRGIIDVIVTDPPYGIRAGARKSGKKEEVTYTIPAERRVDHIPSTQNYPVEEVMLDLLHTAAEMLVLNGLLVYLIPTAYDFEGKDLPRHPCLEVVDICHQPMSSRHGRRAVIMRKAREYTDEYVEEYSQYKLLVMSGKDEYFGQLLKKLITALSSEAFDNDQVVKRIGACCEKRMESRERRQKLKEDGITFPVKHPHPRLGKKNNAERDI